MTEVLIIDCNLTTHDKLRKCAEEAFMYSVIHDFTDPFLALKYGINHRVDILIIQIEMRSSMSASIVHTLKKYNKDMLVILISTTPMRRETDFVEEVDCVIQMPVTQEALKKAVQNIIV